MAYTTIDDPELYFQTKLYTGNGGTLAVTGVGFQPDWVWIKNRPDARDHQIYDSIRGVTKVIGSDRNSAEATVANGLTAFGSDGFTVGSDANVNDNGDSHVAWNWEAGGSASSNSDGSITSTVSANTTSGFSIVKYTGTETAGATVGHGLGVAPDVIIVKNYAVTKEWNVYHSANTSTPQNDYLILNETNATNSNSGRWNNTAPTSSVFTLGEGSETNGNGNTHIAYCFNEVKGYSKFGSYTGNNSTNGAFIYTGFKPAFFMLKKTNRAEDWVIYDNKRDPINKAERILRPNANTAETASFFADILSNGFKLRIASEAKVNGSGDTYIYMAFAESPLVTSTGIPTTAR